MASNIFNSVFFPKVKSNVFDLSYDVKLSLNMGDLVPTHVQEIVPGDKIKMSTESMLRFSPLIAPIMHKVDVYQHFFFVPNRLVWSGWEDFITDKRPAPAFPHFSEVQAEPGALSDYLGLPVRVGSNGDFMSIPEPVSALPFAAYQMIYNEYYRDQNLIDEVNYKLVDGNNDNKWADLTEIRKRAWQHDYFTASLPFAQKGDAVTLPIADFEDVAVKMYNNIGGDDLKGTNIAAVPVEGDGLGDGSFPTHSLVAKTSDLDAGAATINDLRRAFRLQEWLEKNARGGTRYVESILSHFGVKSSDARLQRPEYLGGSKQPVVISEVLQTAEGVETPQGNMSGHGISVGSGKQFSFSAEEHGYIIGIMSVVPKTAYQQGIPKHFSKFDRLDYFWPSFAHLGEQEVLNKELYADGDHQANNAVFGYVPRYSEYKYNDSRVAGEFRTNLSFWHLGRMFTSRPHLNKDFIECWPDTRIFAVEDQSYHKIYGHIFHRIKAVRKMPKYGNPEF